MYVRSSPTHSRRSHNNLYSSSNGESKRSLVTDSIHSDYYQSRGRIADANKYSENSHRAGYSPTHSSSPELLHLSSFSGRYSKLLPQENVDYYESKLLNKDSRTKYGNGFNFQSKHLSRSNSFHDLTNSGRPIDTNVKCRRKTLTSGVSELDLSRARDSFSIHGSSVFSAPNSSSRSAHVSFLSPPVQNYLELPTSTTSSLPYQPAETQYLRNLSSSAYENKTVSSSFNSPYTSLSCKYPPISHPQTSSCSMKEDALFLLNKQDLNEMMNPRKSVYTHIDDTCWQPNTGLRYLHEKSRIQNDELDHKKLSLVNDDVMKLWEETEAENRRLLSDTSRVRSELQETRYEMEEVSWKASSINAVSDIEKREKTHVMNKLSEMEKELKLLAQSENMTDQALSQLKSDNSRLREENKSLIRVISKLSGTSYNPDNNSYVCKHGRIHSYNNYNSYY